MRILLTGGTGFVGQSLGKLLVKNGHEVVVITRNKKSAYLHLSYPADVIEWNLNEKELSVESWPKVEAVVHLMGENVGEGRWTPERKESIRVSRVRATQNLLKNIPASVKTFVGASAIGIYGDTQSLEVSEESVINPGNISSAASQISENNSRSENDFLKDICIQWEAAMQVPSTVRKVGFRLGVVLVADGGALLKVLPIFRSNLGAALGSGKQWMSWIHRQDLCEMMLQSVESDKWEGVYNSVSPSPVTNQDFTKALCKALDVFEGPAVPAIILEAKFGEMAQIILGSQRVKSDRVSQMNFQFLYSDLSMALKECLKDIRKGEEIIYAEQYLDLPIETVFDFFAEAKNLESITPPLLNFAIEKMSTSEIQEGTLIDYKLKVHGVPLGWKTLIREWKPPFQFIDEQLKGPYVQWIHLHQFERLGEGTLMTDLVRYRLPLGVLGKLVAGSFVRSDVEKIFSYRRQRVPELLGLIPNS